jgi:hypothetical protein
MKKRWSSHVSEDISPLGHEQFAANAVEILWHSGPPGIVTTLEGERLAPSKELAHRYVVGLAEKFRQDSFLVKNAPRIGAEAKEIIHIRSLAAALRIALRDSSDLTRIAFQVACIKFDDGLAEDPLIQQCNAAGLPLPGEIGARGEASEWERTLAGLDVFLGHCLRQCSQKIDKGGATNAYKSEWGSPGSALVESAWHVFNMFRPGKATGTDNGPFQIFVETVAEYATGKKEKVSLSEAVKFWAKELRESEFETTTLRRLQLERKSPDTSPQRLEEILREEDAILCKKTTG